MFKEKKTYFYLIFIQSVIPIFNSCKTILQSLEPLIHVLHHNTQRLYKSILLRFVEAEVVSAVESDLDSIGTNLEVNLKKRIKEIISKNVSCLGKSIPVWCHLNQWPSFFCQIVIKPQWMRWVFCGNFFWGFLKSEFLQFQSSPDCAFPPYFDENDKPNRIYAVLTEIAKLKDVSMD